MSLLFDPCRDALLRLHPWNFAVERAALPQLATAPAFGFDKAYALPDDHLRPVLLNDDRDRYRIEAGGLLTDASKAELIYIARITDTTRFDPLFVQCLASYLAAKGAIRITNSQTMEDRMKQRFFEDLQQARSTDAMDDYQDTLFGREFIDAFVGEDQEFRPIASLPTP